MNLKVIEEPVKEVITLEEAKSHLRIDGDDEDNLISSYIKAARDIFKNAYTGKDLHKKTITFS